MSLALRTPFGLLMVLSCTAGCIAPGQKGGFGANAAAAQTGALVRPGGGPRPSSPDPAMPASLPVPPTQATLAQRNVLYSTGTTFTGVGAGLVIGGAVFVTLGVVLPCKDSACKSTSERNGDKALGDALIGGGVAAFIIGGVCLATGIPMMVVGADQIRTQVQSGFYATPDGFGVRF